MVAWQFLSLPNYSNCYSTSYSYKQKLNSIKTRPECTCWFVYSVFFSFLLLSFLILSCLLPSGWSFQMGSAYQFHSWRVFVLVCAFPSVAAISALTTMPESPRFYLEVSERPGIKTALIADQTHVCCHWCLWPSCLYCSLLELLLRMQWRQSVDSDPDCMTVQLLLLFTLQSFLLH